MEHAAGDEDAQTCEGAPFGHCESFSRSPQGASRSLLASNSVLSDVLSGRFRIVQDAR